MTPSDQLKMTVYASLMAALTAAGSFLAVPIGPVPIVLQNLFVMLTALLLGPKWAVASIGVYLLAGITGLPIFAGGTGGIGRILGPTGGYLIGYLPAVFLIGWISRKGKSSVFFDVTAMILGMLVVYSLGVAWLKTVTGMPIGKALAIGMYPFIPGDVLKIAAAVPIVKALRPLVNRNTATDVKVRLPQCTT